MDDEPDWVQAFQSTPASPSNSSGSDVVFTRNFGKGSSSRRSPSPGSPLPTPAESPEDSDHDRDRDKGRASPSPEQAPAIDRRLSKSPGGKGAKSPGSAAAKVDSGKSPGKKSPGKKSPAKKASKKDDAAGHGSEEELDVDPDGNTGEEDGSKRPSGHKPKPTSMAHVSEMPLLLPEKVDTGKVLVEVKDTDGALDLSGDAGAVGRVRVEKQAGGAPDKIFVDLKGVLYLAEIVPSTSFMVVSLGATEAKVESIMSDFMRLKEEGNIFQTETMEGGNLADVFGDADDDDGWVPEGAHGGGDAGGEGAGPKKKKQKKGEEGTSGKGSDAVKKKVAKPRGTGGKPKPKPRGGGKVGARGGGAK
eukprot:jgi/Mesvir1/3329/Mv13714-RA.1